MGTCVETLISAMRAEPWGGAAELDAPAIVRRRDRMVDELGGVPRPALETVFGKELGRRIWERSRHFSGDEVPDEDIVGGMVEYVSRRAGEALRANWRQAKAIGLRVEYMDGVATLYRMRLARPTSDAAELLEAAMELFGRAEARCAGVASVKLNVTSVHAEAVTEGAGGLGFAMASLAVDARV
jgi:hypothetical protein